MVLPVCLEHRATTSGQRLHSGMTHIQLFCHLRIRKRAFKRHCSARVQCLMGSDLDLTRMSQQVSRLAQLLHILMKKKTSGTQDPERRMLMPWCNYVEGSKPITSDLKCGLNMSFQCMRRTTNPRRSASLRINPSTPLPQITSREYLMRPCPPPLI